MDDKDIGITETTTVPDYHDGLRAEGNSSGRSAQEAPTSAKDRFEVRYVHRNLRVLSRGQLVDPGRSDTSTRSPSTILASRSRPDGRVLV